jgi:hypothetical protein
LAQRLEALVLRMIAQQGFGRVRRVGEALEHLPRVDRPWLDIVPVGQFDRRDAAAAGMLGIADGREAHLDFGQRQGRQRGFAGCEGRCTQRHGVEAPVAGLPEFSQQFFSSRRPTRSSDPEKGLAALFIEPYEMAERGLLRLGAGAGDKLLQPFGNGEREWIGEGRLQRRRRRRRQAQRREYHCGQVWGFGRRRPACQGHSGAEHRNAEPTRHEH